MPLTYILEKIFLGKSSSYFIFLSAEDIMQTQDRPMIICYLDDRSNFNAPNYLINLPVLSSITHLQLLNQVRTCLFVMRVALLFDLIYRPAIQLPCASKAVVAVRFCPIFFNLRETNSGNYVLGIHVFGNIYYI